MMPFRDIFPANPLKYMNMGKFELTQIIIGPDVKLSHEALRKKLVSQTALERLQANKIEILSNLYSPIFLSKENKFYLVARHWVYAQYVLAGASAIPGLVFSDESLIPTILEIEDEEIALLRTQAATNEPAANGPEQNVSKKGSKSTKARKKAIDAGRTCPYCGGPLLSPLQPQKDSKGFSKITCHNKSRKGNPCNFYAMLTAVEFEKFTKYELRTEQWLTTIPEKKCPKCGSGLFERKLDEGNSTIKIYEKCCYHHHSTEKNCAYFVFLRDIKA